jgi:fatty acid desaturase
MTFQEKLGALHRDRRNVALIDIATTFAILAGTIFILVYRPGAWSYAFAFVCIGLMQYRIVIACHEAVHKTLLFPLWLNETAGSLQCALVGINLLWYRRQHLEHHAAKGLVHDTDAYIYEPILRARPGVRRLAIWIFGTVGEVVEKLRQKGFTVNATIEAEGTARFYSLAILAVQLLLLAACALWLSWWYYFAFWLCPLLTIAIFINRTRVLVEHGYAQVPRPESAAFAESPVRAVDLAAGIFERFFIAPYRMNYHFAHHRVPSIPSYRNRDLSTLLEGHGDIPSAAFRPSYFQALRHVLWN